jgi:glycine/D-amino acid oxidase-like deaminating enzyme
MRALRRGDPDRLVHIRFPASLMLAWPAHAHADTEITADTHFAAAPHPAQRSVWVVRGGSGHGFKHDPAMAERIATAIASGTTLPAEFSLGERSGSQSLRTASSSRT